MRNGRKANGCIWEILHLKCKQLRGNGTQIVGYWPGYQEHVLPGDTVWGDIRIGLSCKLEDIEPRMYPWRPSPYPPAHTHLIDEQSKRSLKRHRYRRLSRLVVVWKLRKGKVSRRGVHQGQTLYVVLSQHKVNAHKHLLLLILSTEDRGLTEAWSAQEEQ